MSNFILLKQSFPRSRKDRKCDAYDIIMQKTSIKDREAAGLKESEITKTIQAGDKYLYRVGKEDGKFKALHISIQNFEIIRKYLSKILD